MAMKIIFFSALVFNLVTACLAAYQLHTNALSITGEDWQFKQVGWTQTASQIDELVERNDIKKPFYVVSREYQLSSALALYMRSQPIPHSIEKPERNKWSSIEDVSKTGAILVCHLDECDRMFMGVRKRFRQAYRFIGISALTHYEENIRELKVFYMPGK